MKRKEIKHSHDVYFAKLRLMGGDDTLHLELSWDGQTKDKNDENWQEQASGHSQLTVRVPDT